MRLGRPVARVGMGGRGLDREGMRVLCEALDRGVDVVDVAPAWGDSEALAGEAIRTMRARDRVVLATQAPLDRREVQRSVESSLRATRLDAIPLALLAPWRDDRRAAADWPELRDTLERLVREGKVLAWGVAADDPRRAIAALDEAIIAAVQTPFHLQDRRAGALLPPAAERGVAVFARRVLDGGLFDPDTALAFVLGEPAVTCALVRTTRSDHLEKALARR